MPKWEDKTQCQITVIDLLKGGNNDEIISDLVKYHEEWVKNEKVRMLEKRRVPFPLFKHLQKK